MLNTTERLLVQLILHAFPLEGRPVAPAPPALAAWPLIAESAEGHGLAPLLYAALLQCDGEIQAPASIRDKLWIDYLRSSTTQLVAYQALETWLDRFAQEQIPIVLLKGGALALCLYPDPGLRPFGDLDLLVPAAAVERLHSLFLAQGYRTATELSAGFDRHFFAQQAYYRGGRDPSTIELHSHLFAYPYYRHRVPIEWFWSHTATLDLHGKPALAFQPAAQLLHLCAHYALHHREERLIWLYDIALLLTRWGDQIDWTQVIRATQSFGLIQAVQLSLTAVREAWGVGIPTEFGEALFALHPSLSERIAFAAATTTSSGLRNLWDGLCLTGSEGFSFWWHHFFPSREYMQTRYRAAGKYPLPISYLSRIGSGFWRTVEHVASHKLT